MVSKDAVMTVFVVSVALALGVQFYREIYVAYLEPDHDNVSTSPLNDTRLQELIAQDMVILTYYYRNDCPSCRDQTPLMEDLADGMNDTVHLVKVNVASHPNANISSVPAIRIESRGGEMSLEGVVSTGIIAGEIVNQVRTMERTIPNATRTS
ncbi:MAG: thioredoxin family protein [Candidatus Undinarchaeales archaeon]|jgi:thiol-disulfide isomerase/thioredoxin|nr:thioredoxin family protein [Candidatus Undinarchaeales archaeon]MDP7493408.1 thioredoxin family protein [Candidatus Undinarchaeales archaeon]